MIENAKFYGPRFERNSCAAPIMAATKPPTNIQIALSVGEPVKNRDTSELNEFVALTPKATRTTPAIRKAQAMVLFIVIFDQK